jgi:hypothetical protein
MAMTMKIAMGIERLGWNLALWNMVVYVAVCSATYVIGGTGASLAG